jgi:hypothetical protein
MSKLFRSSTVIVKKSLWHHCSTFQFISELWAETLVCYRNAVPSSRPVRRLSITGKFCILSFTVYEPFLVAL